MLTVYHFHDWQVTVIGQRDVLPCGREVKIIIQTPVGWQEQQVDLQAAKEAENPTIARIDILF